MACLSVVVTTLQVVEQDDPTLQRLKSDLAAAKRTLGMAHSLTADS